MRSKCSRRRHVAAAGDGEEDVAALGGLERGEHVEALHPRLERAQRVDLADDDRRAGAAGAQGDAAARPAVAEDDDGLAGEQHVRRADDAVERRLARAEAVVERALGVGLVDREHRAAEVERAQVHEAAAGLLGRAAQRAVQPGDELGAVVEDEVGPGGRHRVEAGLVVAGVDARAERARRRPAA
jgi:hypothetical protein